MSKLLLQTELNLVFRGSRDYYYGPDMFIQSVNSAFNYFETESISNVDFSVHKMAHTGLDLYLYDEPREEDNDLSYCNLRFTHLERDYYGYLLSNNKKLSDSTSYNEEEVFDAGHLDMDNKLIVLEEQTSFLLTDTFTALNKYMHYKIFPNLVGKWTFVRIKFPVFKRGQTYSKLKVIHNKNFHNRYTQNNLYLNGEKFGTLYFSIISSL